MIVAKLILPWESTKLCVVQNALKKAAVDKRPSSEQTMLTVKLL